MSIFFQGSHLCVVMDSLDEIANRYISMGHRNVRLGKLRHITQQVYGRTYVLSMFRKRKYIYCRLFDYNDHTNWYASCRVRVPIKHKYYYDQFHIESMNRHSSYRIDYDFFLNSIAKPFPHFLVERMVVNPDGEFVVKIPLVPNPEPEGEPMTEECIICYETGKRGMSKYFQCEHAQLCCECFHRLKQPCCPLCRSV